MMPSAGAAKRNRRPDGNGATTGTILHYFQSLPQPNPQTPSPRSRPAVASSSPPSSAPPSSPLLRHEPVAQPVLEIGASDEDDSDGAGSDHSLEDLSSILGRGRPAASHSGGREPSSGNLWATPRAKRTAIEFHSSPLAIIPRHKFDIKALAKDALRDDATTASSMKVKAAADDARRSPAPSPLRDAIAGVVRAESGLDAHKILRAVQRSEPGPSQPRYYFFDRHYIPPPPPEEIAEQELGQGPWPILARGSPRTREQHLASGVPQTMIRKMKHMPDSVLQWMLDDLCVQPSAIVRQEYCRMVADCRPQVQRLLTPRRLEDLLVRLGAIHLRDCHHPSASDLELTSPGQEPYADRDWSCLASFFALLAAVARSLSVPAAEYGLQVLTQMALDRILICTVDLLDEYQKAVCCLADAIPKSLWDKFSLQTCSCLYAASSFQGVRINALLCLPIRHTKTLDLRTRLALSFLLDDVTLACKRPTLVVTMRRMLGLLEQPRFAIKPKTDFAELKASMMLLDMVIDSAAVGGFEQEGEEDEVQEEEEEEAESRFNREVDELAEKLREIWRKIDDSGMRLARTEAKSVIELVQQRLSSMIRTRKRARKSVFDLPPSGEQASLPRQQEYMRAFLRRQPDGFVGK